MDESSEAGLTIAAKNALQISRESSFLQFVMTRAVR
jgi:hypothetical protein